MRIIRIFKRYLRSPRKLIKVLGALGWFNWFSDRIYLKLVFWAETGKKLNLKNPKTYNEKLQWLKLYDRKPEYSIYVDKYAVRSYIEKTIGDTYLIPLLGIYNSVEEIDWNSLPNKFVLKCTHGSGSNIICTDKNKLDIQASKMKLNKWMKKSWYWFGREWPYKNVKKRIIAEKFLYGIGQAIPKDYKFWTFNGKVKFTNVHFHDNYKTKINIYNRNWELQNYGMVYENDLNILHKKPRNYNKMINYSEKIAKELKLRFVRVDFYEVGDKIYSGEITFFPTSGFIKFYPDHNTLDKKYGDLLKL